MAFTMNVNPTEDVWPPLPTVQNKIDDVIAKVDYTTTVKIVQGFDMEVKGDTYHFSFLPSDQTNFLMMMMNAQSEIMTTMGGAIAGIAMQGISTMEEPPKTTAPVGDTSDDTGTPEDDAAGNGDGESAEQHPTGGEEGGADAPSEKVWCTWQGHKDGVSHTLPFTRDEFVTFAMSVGKKKESILSEGWTLKDKLRAVKSEAELVKLIESEEIEERYQEAQDKARSLDLTDDDIRAL